jgi:hypothetical protein
LNKIRVRWEQALRQGIARLPNIRLRERAAAVAGEAKESTIELVESPTPPPEGGHAPDAAAPELQAQMGQRPRRG